MNESHQKFELMDSIYITCLKNLKLSGSHRWSKWKKLILKHLIGRVFTLNRYNTNVIVLALNDERYIRENPSLKMELDALQSFLNSTETLRNTQSNPNALIMCKLVRLFTITITAGTEASDLDLMISKFYSFIVVCDEKMVIKYGQKSIPNQVLLSCVPKSNLFYHGTHITNTINQLPNLTLSMKEGVLHTCMSILNHMNEIVITYQKDLLQSVETLYQLCSVYFTENSSIDENQLHDSFHMVTTQLLSYFTEEQITQLFHPHPELTIVEICILWHMCLQASMTVLLSPSTASSTSISNNNGKTGTGSYDDYILLLRNQLQFIMYGNIIIRMYLLTSPIQLSVEDSTTINSIIHQITTHFIYYAYMLWLSTQRLSVSTSLSQCNSQMNEINRLIDMMHPEISSIECSSLLPNTTSSLNNTTKPFYEISVLQGFYNTMITTTGQIATNTTTTTTTTTAAAAIMYSDNRGEIYIQYLISFLLQHHQTGYLKYYLQLLITCVSSDYSTTSGQYSALSSPSTGTSTIEYTHHITRMKALHVIVSMKSILQNVSVLSYEQSKTLMDELADKLNLLFTPYHETIRSYSSSLLFSTTSQMSSNASFLNKDNFNNLSSPHYYISTILSHKEKLLKNSFLHTIISTNTKITTGHLNSRNGDKKQDSIYVDNTDYFSVYPVVYFSILLDLYKNIEHYFLNDLGTIYCIDMSYTLLDHINLYKSISTSSTLEIPLLRLSYSTWNIIFEYTLKIQEYHESMKAIVELYKLSTMIDIADTTTHYTETSHTRTQTSTSTNQEISHKEGLDTIFNLKSYLHILVLDVCKFGALSTLIEMTSTIQLQYPELSLKSHIVDILLTSAKSTDIYRTPSTTMSDNNMNVTTNGSYANNNNNNNNNNPVVNYYDCLCVYLLSTHSYIEVCRILWLYSNRTVQEVVWNRTQALQCSYQILGLIYHVMKLTSITDHACLTPEINDATYDIQNNMITLKKIQTCLNQTHAQIVLSTHTPSTDQRDDFDLLRLLLSYGYYNEALSFASMIQITQLSYENILPRLCYRAVITSLWKAYTQHIAWEEMEVSLIEIQREAIYGTIPIHHVLDISHEPEYENEYEKDNNELHVSTELTKRNMLYKIIYDLISRLDGPALNWCLYRIVCDDSTINT